MKELWDFYEPSFLFLICLLFPTSSPHLSFAPLLTLAFHSLAHHHYQGFQNFVLEMVASISGGIQLVHLPDTSLLAAIFIGRLIGDAVSIPAQQSRESREENIVTKRHCSNYRLYTRHYFCRGVRIHILDPYYSYSNKKILNHLISYCQI